ncbi:hypothetical protein [Blastopirellula marina]|uniref:Carboxypeptidase regulatory-like domain-containing protein n=1 Tax=Blastopirellula marina TaxID=124 RepID=A0A2S8GNS6_9BACT|nr:hypothetical protein [Blastopirellula marina]PQO46075.1 hypothetical protein C5Y93_10895 [Blastopirellula marina]
MQTLNWQIAGMLRAALTKNRTSLWLLLPIVVALVGCSQSSDDPRTFHVQGTATLAGKPIPRGGITFDPDGTLGNSGPQGYAEIVDGKFNTRQNGRATTGGDQVVTISAYDGVATEDNPEGSPLFFGWNTKVKFTDEKYSTMDFDVKKSDKSFQGT